MRIISIDGGGYLGLATASFLQSVEARFETRCADRFDLFCGTSTGAIIALALASGKSAGEVVTLYEQLGRQLFTLGGSHHMIFRPPTIRFSRVWWKRQFHKVDTKSEIPVK